MKAVSWAASVSVERASSVAAGAGRGGDENGNGNVPRGFSPPSSCDAASRQRTCLSMLFNAILALSSAGICAYLALHFCASCFAAAHEGVCATASGEAELERYGRWQDEAALRNLRNKECVLDEELRSCEMWN